MEKEESRVVLVLLGRIFSEFQTIAVYTQRESVPLSLGSSRRVRPERAFSATRRLLSSGWSSGLGENSVWFSEMLERFRASVSEPPAA